MDLKIKDVAELLNVSETTIRRWLIDGKIPAYLLGNQYRFDRLEIEDWVMNRRVGVEKEEKNESKGRMKNSKLCNVKCSKRGSQKFSLYRAIFKGGVFSNVPGETKEEVICNTMKLLADDLDLDGEVITELLLDRERLQPTALGNGIAVPHPRESLVSFHQDVIAVVFPKKPIFYGALDDQPVHTLFFLFSQDDKRHLHLLAKIAHLSSQKSVLRFLSQRPAKQKLLEFIKKFEEQIQEEKK